ncbi:hypothetical protein CNYM01_12871 [Colletotrichum nymphaeae SA-01]|uniref:Uncharacterized protein n=1 Tax=Colletotrichum nymphaeae SA-01 TaxID=1460502 RepID=A0A135S5N2_9PEZI|nr:hypothetical protein CNYM01_12871 [Colletotrichum nymphaeae SA-01]
MSNKTGSNGSMGNSSNPRPGQSPFPPSNALVRRTPSGSQQSQPYTSSYSNNFDRSSARYSTGRTDESSRYSQETTEPPKLSRPPPSRREQKKPEPNKNWEDSIYGMYGDIKTPREPPLPPPPRQQQQQQRRRYEQPEDDEGNNSFDEEVPRRPEPRPEPQRPRNSRQRQNSRPEQRRQNSRQDQQRNQQDDNRDEDGARRRVHVNIDIGGDGGRSWSWTSDSRGPNTVNFDNTPFVGGGFPFGGRNNNGGRLPVNIPFGGGLPINLPFGL